MPPAEWEGDILHNLKTISGYNHCDQSSEAKMLDCLAQLEQYDLLKFSHKRSYRFVTDNDLVNEPYMELIKVILGSRGSQKVMINLELGLSSIFGRNK